MNKTTSISIIFAALIIGGVLYFSSPESNTAPVITPGSISTSTVTATGTNNIKVNNSSGNLTIENGVQIITLQAKGGYSPRQSVAQAGIPTVIRFVTNGTFDCSISIRIPSLNLSQYLPQTGSTDINIGTQSAGTFRGSCGMGMYPFEVDFK